MSLSPTDHINGGPMLIRARQLLTMVPNLDAIREPPQMGDLDGLRERDAKIVGLVEDGAVRLDGDRIDFVGPWSSLPPRARKKTRVVEANVVMPGWIDCHTHAVFAGWRHLEFTQRNLGAEYLQILEDGGGILNSVQAVRSSRKRTLAQSLVQRCFQATRQGITTVEVKSGYGLALDQELKQLSAIQMAAPEVLVDIQPTFLGAHVVPAEHRGQRDVYIDLLCNEMIPQVAQKRLARFCDVFCDRGAFTVDESRQILQVGIEHGLLPRLHADELCHVGAAELAAELGACSADHLEFVSDAAIMAMAASGVTAVLLPGVNLFLNLARHAPARRLLSAGVDVALATDFNPGTSPTQDLGLILTLACIGYGMTPGEAALAVTRSAARALRLDDRGTLQVGQLADLTVLGVDDYWQVPYLPGQSHVEGVVKNGELVYWVSGEELEE